MARVLSLLIDLALVGVLVYFWPAIRRAIREVMH